jgi:hypothetical protein
LKGTVSKQFQEKVFLGINYERMTG